MSICLIFWPVHCYIVANCLWWWWRLDLGLCNSDDGRRKVYIVSPFWRCCCYITDPVGTWHDGSCVSAFWTFLLCRPFVHSAPFVCCSGGHVPLLTWLFPVGPGGIWGGSATGVVWACSSQYMLLIQYLDGWYLLLTDYVGIHLFICCSFVLRPYDLTLMQSWKRCCCCSTWCR
jgi:hypothetical protein